MRTSPYLCFRIPLLHHLPLPKISCNTNNICTEDGKNPQILVLLSLKYQGYISYILAAQDQSRDSLRPKVSKTINAKTTSTVRSLHSWYWNSPLAWYRCTVTLKHIPECTENVGWDILHVMGLAYNHQFFRDVRKYSESRIRTHDPGGVRPPCELRNTISPF